MLERKLKKERKKEERKRLREAGTAAAQKPPARRSGAELALDYLCSWAQKHQDWRFQKTRQTWLLLHMYDSDKVPDKHFSTLLAYLEGLRGRARELTVQKAEALMQELDEAGAASPDPLLLEKTQRLRQVLQLLSQGRPVGEATAAARGVQPLQDAADPSPRWGPSMGQAGSPAGGR